MSPKLFFPIVLHRRNLLLLLAKHTVQWSGCVSAKIVFNVCKQSFEFTNIHMHQEFFQEIISNIHKDFSFKIFVLYTCINFQSWIFFMVINHMLESTGYSFWDRLRNFLQKLHELFCQFINWTNWINSGKFIVNCWISCQVMADMKKVYDDLIIINL